MLVEQRKAMTRADILKAGIPAALLSAGLLGASASPAEAAANALRWFDVRDYGATGNGTTDDTAAFNNAVSATGGKGVLYMPPGQYRISSTITVPMNVQVIGAGSQATEILHTGNNPLFVNTQFQSEAMRQRAFRRFKITGNAGTSARGIVISESWGAAFDDLFIMNYSGGIGIHVLNQNNGAGWTEGTRFFGVHIRGCAKQVYLQRTTGHESFSDTRFYHTTLVCTGANQIGLEIGNNIVLYDSTLDLKIHLEGNNTTAIKVGTNVVMRGNTYNVGIESPGSGTGMKILQIPNGSELTGTGAIMMPLGGVATWDIADNANVQFTPRHDDMLPNQTGNKASWRGTANTGTYLYRDSFRGERHNRYANSGYVYGNNIQSTYTAIYEAPGNAFEVLKVPYNGYPWTTATPIVGFEASGARVRLGAKTAPGIFTGSGSPEGVVSAPIGSLYTNTAGGASTTLYVKTSGTGATGWTAK
jgi:hypothetical protein